MKGDLVLVRTARGAGVVMKVYGEIGQHVAVATVEDFDRIENGESALQPVGFPREDVFKHDSQTSLSLNEIQWGLLEPY